MAVTVIRLGEGVAESAALLRAASIAATISAVASIPISPINSGFGFGLNSSESSVSYCQGASESSNKLSIFCLLPHRFCFASVSSWPAGLRCLRLVRTPHRGCFV